MAEANFLAITDTFLTRLIMKIWLICALETDCLIADGSPTLCNRQSYNVHRYDQSAMVIILTYFYFQGNLSTWSEKNLNDPAPYDMFTSIQINLGDIKRNDPETDYLSGKKRLVKR